MHYLCTKCYVLACTSPKVRKNDLTSFLLKFTQDQRKYKLNMVNTTSGYGCKCLFLLCKSVVQ